MNSNFRGSFTLTDHPISGAVEEISARYFSALAYIVTEVAKTLTVKESGCPLERLKIYQSTLFSDNLSTPIKRSVGSEAVKYFLGGLLGVRPELPLLICDLFLIFYDEPLVTKALEYLLNCCEKNQDKEPGFVEEIGNCNRKRHLSTAMQIVSKAFKGQAAEDKGYDLTPLIRQLKQNANFFAGQELRIAVTATMSAGKSTLVNALIGKPLSRTSDECCTGNVCYLFNKPFEDGRVHLEADDLTLNANMDELRSYSWDAPIAVSSYFTPSVSSIPRVCFVDTPGVDAEALHKEHCQFTHQALQEEEYDRIICVIATDKAGTDAGNQHIQWIAQNLPKDKVIFVLNKIDKYKKGEDNLADSLQKIKQDLLKFGFKNPTICPISAYFSYLLKLKMAGKTLSEEDADEYDLLSRRFSRSFYDVSGYYKNVRVQDTDSEFIKLSKRAGLYGLEKMLYSI